MGALDIFFVVVFIIGLIKGYTKGLVVEVFSFVAFFVGLFVAINLSIPVADTFFADSEYSKVVMIGVFIVLFLIAVIIINVLAKMIKKVLDLTFLGFFDNVLGAVASIFKWAFIISVFFWVFDSLGFRLPEDFISASKIYPFVESLGPKTFEWIGKQLPFIKDMIDSLKNVRGNEETVLTFL